MFGIDIYDRYQDIVDALALKRSAFDFAYVKGTDGGGAANTPPDEFVRILQGNRIPVGLYHYAQFTPTPEQQARVLAAKVNALNARGLPPALDLEDPFPMAWSSRDFAVRFLRELRRLGFPQVVLYANTSMLNAIQAWTIDAEIGGGLLVWAANYGDNDADYDQADRDRLARAYPHPVWMHQYSSTGPVPGVPGNVDKNWMFGDPSNGEDDMLKDEKIRFWQDANGPHGEAAGWYEIPADQTLGWIHNFTQGAARDAAISRAQTALILERTTGEEITGDLIAQRVGEELDKRPVTLLLTDTQFAELAEDLQLSQERVEEALTNVLRRGVGYAPPDAPEGNTPVPQA